MLTDPPTPARIDRFVGDHRWLSNFFVCPVRDEQGRVYASIEHAYQAAKATTEEDRLRIASAPSPTKAKHYGAKLDLPPGWNDRRLSVMRALLADKFAAGTELAARLLATGDAVLIEGNTWGDRFWGVDGIGENHLGRLLMERRAQLQTARPPGDFAPTPPV